LAERTTNTSGADWGDRPDQRLVLRAGLVDNLATESRQLLAAGLFEFVSDE